MYKKNFFVLKIMVIFLVLNSAFVSCDTGDNGSTDDKHQSWKKEQFYSTEDNPWVGRGENSSLTLVFTQSQLKFRYDLNNDGDFEDSGEYTYTYTIIDFGGNDWMGEMGTTFEGDYERKITVSNETKTGTGTNANLSQRTEFWVSPNLGDNGKIDDTIFIFYGSTWEENYRFAKR